MRRIAPALLVIVLAVAATSALDESAQAPSSQQAQAPASPRAVRNDAPRAGREVLVLRHQQLKKGAHDAYYRSSREGVWPWYEKIGTRIVGQWLVTRAPNGAASDADDAYRLARYASFDHWRATRDVSNANLGGDGPDREKSLQSGRDRGGVQTGSKGAYFLQGETATTRPLYMPALEERYERVSATEGPAVTDDVIATRGAVAQPGREVVELRYQRIEKGGFDRFVAATRDAIWPWEEKLGARPIGQWKVIYPQAPSRTAESPDFDEVITLTRYASADHLQAMQPDRAVLLGGNGPDWRAWRAAVDAQTRAVRQTTIELMEGEMYFSPPIFMPPLPERYKVVR